MNDDVKHDDPLDITEEVTVAPDADVPADIEERLAEERTGEDLTGD